MNTTKKTMKNSRIANTCKKLARRAPETVGHVSVCWSQQRQFTL